MIRHSDGALLRADQLARDRQSESAATVSSAGVVAPVGHLEDPLQVRFDHEPRELLGLRIEVSTPRRPLSEVEATIARRPFHRLAGLPGLGLDLAIADAILRQSCARLSIQEIGEGMRLVVALPPAARPLGDAA